MSKSASISTDVSRQVLLTYSTWLVVGGWLLFTGARLIYQGSSGGDNSLSDYFWGAVRLLAGANAWKTAQRVALKSNQPESSFIRLMTSLLVTIMFVLPLLLFIFQTLVTLLGTYQPGELYRENVTRILPIAVGYMIAVVYADWRLRKQFTDAKKN